MKRALAPTLHHWPRQYPATHYCWPRILFNYFGTASMQHRRRWILQSIARVSTVLIRLLYWSGVSWLVVISPMQ